MATKAPVSINDPIHGSIELSAVELALLDTRPLQRLRNIKQLGFSEMAFPGATHSRFAHSLGAMQMATRMFDRIVGNIDVALSDAHRRTLRQAVRMGMLCHDLGHPPLSHVSERMMPMLKSLQLPQQVQQGESQERQATHEDYTLKLLYDSELGVQLSRSLAQDGIDAALLASLITGRRIGDAPLLQHDGIDWLPLLHAIISGELDADRMDYLRRDAHFCGVSYGNFDHNWLCANLTAVRHGDSLALGLKHKGVWAFENFLLARYHMFLSVYYHHTSIGFEHLLGRFFAEGEYLLPSDSDAYLETDDVQLTWAMRQSRSPWAKAVVRREPWALLLESHHYDLATDEKEWLSRLEAAGMHIFATESRGLLSKYFSSSQVALSVVEPERERVRPIAAYTPLYERFATPVNVARIYCQPQQLAKARSVLSLAEEVPRRGS